MFLVDDEYIVLMSLNNFIEPYCVTTLDDRKRFRDVGIQTTIEYPERIAIEPAQGIYDFSLMDEMLEKNRAADLKTIFTLNQDHLPNWMPDDWFGKNKDGVIVRFVLSLWNTEAQESLKEYYKTVIQNFAAPDVLFIFGEWQCGEGALPPTPSYYDDAALASYGGIPDIANDETRKWLGASVFDHFINRYSEFCDYQGRDEIWNAQQWLINQWGKGSGNYMQSLILGHCKEVGIDIVLLQYTYYDAVHGKENENYVDGLKNFLNCDVIVEAHYAKGFKMTTPPSIAKGFRGQIVCPTHPVGGFDTFEPWMFAEIAWAHNQWVKGKIE